MIDRNDSELMQVLRERPIYLLAKEYSQSPEQVRNWSDYDVKRAWLHLTAENQKEFAPEDVKRVKPMTNKPGFILDCDYSHWQKFLTNDELDAEKLRTGGYTGEQFEYIQDEMVKLGWLGDRMDTQPLDLSAIDLPAEPQPLDAPEE